MPRLKISAATHFFHDTIKIVDFDIIKSFTVWIKFDDETERSIDFRNVRAKGFIIRAIRKRKCI
jgi:hypothetical protein